MLRTPGVYEFTNPVRRSQWVVVVPPEHMGGTVRPLHINLAAAGGSITELGHKLRACSTFVKSSHKIYKCL